MSLKGVANIATGEEKHLTEFNGEAVVSITPQGQWKIRPHGDTDNSGEVMIIFQPDGDVSTERVLTLSKGFSGDWAKVVVREPESPPSDRQLWTLEDSIVQPRNPPIVHGRIQSVARPNLSLDIAGAIPLPRLYMNVAATPNEQGSDSQKWRLDYVSIE